MNELAPVQRNAKLILHVHSRGIGFCASLLDWMTNLMSSEPFDEVLIIKYRFNLNDYECYATLVRSHAHILWSILDERFLSPEFLLSLIKNNQIKYVKI